jgi:hypothetical protein
MLSGIGERSSAKWGSVICGCCAVWLCAASACCAQATQAPRTRRTGSDARVATKTMRKAPTGLVTLTGHQTVPLGQKAEGPLSISDMATQPASVRLRDGKLTVDANDSDLSQILRDLANISGMTIKGLNKGPRVFGVYGPGNMRDILTELLVGSGYNFIMMGGAVDGTPRELVLTSRTNIAPALIPANPRFAPPTNQDEAEHPELETDPSASNALGPGAISPAPSLDDQDDNIRTERNLQRLQKMQEQQQNVPKH